MERNGREVKGKLKGRMSCFLKDSTCKSNVLLLLYNFLLTSL